LTCLGGRREPSDDVDALAGLGQTHPLTAAAIATFMFSLAGVPPLAGFWGKFALFSGAIDLGAPVAGEQSDVQSWFLALAIVAVANAAIAAAYYLRVVATMYFRSPQSAAAPIAADAAEPNTREPAPAIAAAVCFVLVIIVGIAPWPAIEVSDAAGTAVSRSSGVEPTTSDVRDTASAR
jgi:NADH-quinone oxidoreductase subunit N